MTRIYSLSLESGNGSEGRFLLVQVAHRDSRGAVRAALAEAKKSGGSWRVVHKAARRTTLRIPQGELLGVSGPFSYQVDEA